MISNYEIRENSLTENSVYILLLKADTQGKETFEHEFAGICKLTEEKIQGFDYVFELLGITDEGSLEKIKTRIDFISSSISGITQTFGNESNTATIDISTKISEDYKVKTASTFIKKDDLQSKKAKDNSPKNKGEKSSINLANTGFSFTTELTDETNFHEINTNSSLISGDEKRIDIGDNSLKLAKTMTNMNNNMPSLSDLPQKEDVKKIKTVNDVSDTQEETSDIEKENKKA